MRSSGTGADVSPIPSSVVAFKPRQVILLEHNRTNSARLKSMATNQSEQELTLSYSIALWLEKKGFSKVLKRFLSAAKIQDDEWKAKALNLNEMFSKHMEINVDASKDSDPEKRDGDKKHIATSENESQTRKNKKKKIDGLTDNGTEKAEDRLVEKQGDKKKKKSKSLDDEENKIDLKPEPTDEKQEGIISNGSLQSCDHVIADESKHKKKKQLKTDNPLNGDGNVDLDKKEDCVHLEDSQVAEKKTTKKEKKTKVQKTTPTEVLNATENKDDESTKASKKRKRKALDENETQSGQESKPKKTKSLEESEDVQQQQNEHIVEPNKKQSLQDEHTGSLDLSTKQTEKAINSNGGNKSAKKQQKNSAEPKSANSFQRVKVEEVDFVDDRLQDNSYWAKDGADTGYGAKAQEVLGQVKGRDFRHEKTKKKRGSYRGGQIDLQSHSVKFNYSDEE